MSHTLVPVAHTSSSSGSQDPSSGSIATNGADTTYDQVSAAIDTVAIHGARIRVTWKDPRTGAPIGESVATMSPDDSLAARLQARAKRSLVHEVAGGIMRAISNALGGSAGRIVRDVAYTASYELQSRAMAGVAYTEASRRDAVVRAFASVRGAFVWDEASLRYVGR